MLEKDGYRRLGCASGISLATVHSAVKSNDGRKRRWEIEMVDRTVRMALQRHWDASDASDFKVEHEIYCEEAVLVYPQSGEQIR
jgi:hypothetical protein